jgi:hypothetical protein
MFLLDNLLVKFMPLDLFYSKKVKYLTIPMVGKTLAAHMLSGNFATDRVTTLNNKANSVNPSVVLPQKNACMIEQESMRDMITNTEKSMNVLDARKSKAKTSIARIGTMVSIGDEGRPSDVSKGQRWVEKF